MKVLDSAHQSKRKSEKDKDERNMILKQLKELRSKMKKEREEFHEEKK